METRLIIIVSLIFYIKSVRLCYDFMKKAHSKDGRWYSLNPGPLDLFVTFFPFLNFIIGLCNPYEATNLSKFFNVKK